MTNKTVSPGSTPTEAEAKETERRIFEGLAGVKMFPLDPSGPGQPPGQMLPVSSFLRSEASQPASRPEFVGPIEQAMRAHPGLTRAEAEEMAEAFGFSTATISASQPTPAEEMAKRAQKSTPQLSAHEKALEIESQALNDRLRASGLTVTVKAPPKGTAPFVATFHRAKRKPTKGEN
jgi:hypothetical protein